MFRVGRLIMFPAFANAGNISCRMIKKIIVAILLLLLYYQGFSQEPAEAISFCFINNLKKNIYPELQIIGKKIDYNRKNKKLKVRTDTIKINALLQMTSNQNDRWMQIDTTGYKITSPNNNHYLDEEIKVIAVYDKKQMTILFVGQGMANYVWQEMNRIEFEEGNFIYVAGFGSTSVIKLRLPKELEMLSSKSSIAHHIDPLKNLQGVTNHGQLLPIAEVLEFNDQHNGMKLYNGFLFEGCMLIGFVWLDDKNKQIVLFNKPFIDFFKKNNLYYSGCETQVSN